MTYDRFMDNVLVPISIVVLLGGVFWGMLEQNRRESEAAGRAHTARQEECQCSTQ